jgi:mitochondrial fission protein ELM1
MADRDLLCWGISEGFASQENQIEGLAHALGLAVQFKRVAAALPWRRLPPSLWISRIGHRALRGDGLIPPWPDALISCGGQGALGGYVVRRLSAKTCFTVQIQTPALSLREFDAVVVPRHDGTSGENVVVTEGAIHRVTPQRLKEEAAHWEAPLRHLPNPRVAVLLGGSNGRYRMTDATVRDLAGQLSQLIEQGCSVLLATSRRTSESAKLLLQRALDKNAWIWTGEGANPYLAFLGLADFLLVSRDSVSMVSEALSTGKPVYTFDLLGHSKRIDRFHARLESTGYTRPFKGALERWSYAPLDDTRRAAEMIRPLLEARVQSLRVELPAKAMVTEDLIGS